MDYKKVEEHGSDLILTDIKNFILPQVLDNGQCFRWQTGIEGEPDINTYTGIAHGRLLTVSLDKTLPKGYRLIFKNTSKNEFETIWCDYFDLHRDYGKLRKLYTKEPTLKNAIAHSPGLRLMRQDPWETLVTFILSQNSNIPRIRGMVSRLCQNFGKPLPAANGKTVFAFPLPADLANKTVEELADVKTGYRAPYIIDAAKRVADGRINFEKFSSLSTDELKTELMGIHGVGPKVADCVLLYGFGRIEQYPMDVWMKRVMETYYPNGFPEDIKDTAGIAQQFLFHYIRTKD